MHMCAVSVEEHIPASSTRKLTLQGSRGSMPSPLLPPAGQPAAEIDRTQRRQHLDTRPRGSMLQQECEKRSQVTLVSVDGALGQAALADQPAMPSEKGVAKAGLKLRRRCRISS